MLLLGVLLCAQLAAGEFVSSVDTSKLEDVTIAGHIAEIRRSFTVDALQPGYHVVSVNNFPASVDEASIRVEGKGACEILSTQITSTQSSRKQNPAYLKLVLDLQSVKRQFEEQSTLLKLDIDRETSRLNNMQAYLTKTTSMTTLTDIDSFLKLLDIDDDLTKKVNVEVFRLQSQLTEIQWLIDRITSALTTLESTGVFDPISSSHKFFEYLPTSRITFTDNNLQKSLLLRIYIPVDTYKGSNKYSFTISYMSQPASWTPSYDIHIEGDMKPTKLYDVVIDFFAAVLQSTGEAWVNTKLRLSTSTPASLSPLHEPKQPRYSFQSPRVYGGRPMMAKANMAMRQDFAGAAPAMEAEEMFEMAMDAADVQVGGDLGAAYTFMTHRDVNISSTSPGMRRGLETNAHRLMLTSITVPSRVFTYLSPTTSLTPHLLAWGNLTSTAPLLDASARVFLQGAYVGRTSIPTTQPTDTLKLQLGDDKQLSVTSTYIPPTQRSQEEDKSTWFVSDKKKYRFKVEEYQFSVKSAHTSPQLVILTEYVPSAAEEEIKIELLSPKHTLPVDVAHHDGMILAALQHSSLQTVPTAKNSNNGVIFFNENTKQIVWAQWVLPGETVNVVLKYRVVWPDGRDVNTLRR